MRLTLVKFQFKKRDERLKKINKEHTIQVNKLFPLLQNEIMKYIFLQILHVTMLLCVFQTVLYD